MRNNNEGFVKDCERNKDKFVHMSEGIDRYGYQQPDKQIS